MRKIATALAIAGAMMLAACDSGQQVAPPDTVATDNGGPVEKDGCPWTHERPCK